MSSHIVMIRILLSEGLEHPRCHEFGLRPPYLTEEMTMRARICASSAVVVTINLVAINFAASTLLAISGSTALGQPNDLQYAVQIASCPTILPAEEGERSIVVPNEAPDVAPPADVPHVASLPNSPVHEAAKSLLKAKLAERDQLQREITALRNSTQTPEQISVHVKIVEINRTKLRQVHVDWAQPVNGKLSEADLAAVLGVDSGPKNSALGFLSNLDPSVLDFIAALERHNIGRELASPTMVVLSGQPGTLHVGSEIPIASPAAPGGIHTLKCGTQVDLTADAVGDNRVRINIRPRISAAIGDARVNQNGDTPPALSVRQLDTAFESEFGKTTILSGLVQERTESRTDQFGRKSDETQEIALMFIVTPQIVR
jgi:hypothetical protein